MDMEWSSQTNKLEKGEVPLPLLAMLHVYDKEKPDEFNEWVECSPYEVFMPKYGVGINMKHFGSEFDGGFVKTKYPEQPAHVLQGICGSAYIAVLETERRDTGASSSVQSWISMIETFMTEKLEKIAVGKIPNWLYGVSDMKKILKEQDITRKDISKDDVKSMKKVVTEISWKDISDNDVEVMKKVIKKLSWEDFSEDDKNRIGEDLKGISTDDQKKKNDDTNGDIESMKNVLTNISREDITKGDVNSINKVLQEILKMDNKSLKMVVNDSTEIDINSMKKVIDSKNEALMLTDAGIKFNSPYPLVLHPARKIDLILSFEFSAPGDVSEWPFSELRKAQNWAECRNIPFPDLSDIDTYKTEPIKNLYVFKGTNSPTIMHFVMYDQSRKETREQCDTKVQTFFEEYATLKFNYSNEDFDRLSKLMKYIVKNNEQKIKKQIGDAIKSKIKRESHAETE